MAAADLIRNLFQLSQSKLNKKESCLLEIVFISEISKKFMQMDNFQSITKKYSQMFNESIIKLLINDLLVSEEYSLQGIALYTGYPEEIIVDLASGLNKNPTFTLALKIIDLHTITRKDFYKKLIRNFLNEIEDDDH